MMKSSKESGPPDIRREGDAQAIQHLKTASTGGKNWYIALLEAIGIWSSPDELHRGRRYRYLIGNEAFDWLLLAERLCQELTGIVPEEDIIAFLFNGTPPVKLSKGEFKRLMGTSKYKAHLNYVYGVVAEEALLVAVEEEVRKERRVMGFEGRDVMEEAFIRVYGTPQNELLKRFVEERSIRRKDLLTLDESREFTYWLFKYRVAAWDPERVASDTRKALSQLQKVGARNLNL